MRPGVTSNLKIIDLSLIIEPSMPVFPGSPKPALVPWSNFSTQGYDSESVFLSTHTGTHMDAPSHFLKGALTIDRVHPSRLVCNATLIRLPKRAGQVIEKEELENKDINANDTVIISTGWEKRLRKSNYMTKNPGLSKSAALYLARKKVNAIGIDGPSIDPGEDAPFSAHNILLPSGILIIENLCNLDAIGQKEFILVVCPLKIADATGSPVRALALKGFPPLEK